MTPLGFVKANEDRLYYLRDRWLDEGKYEDFDAYRDAIRNLLPEGWTLVRATSRPFEFELATPTHKEKPMTIVLTDQQAKALRALVDIYLGPRGPALECMPEWEGEGHTPESLAELRAVILATIPENAEIERGAR